MHTSLSTLFFQSRTCVTADYGLFPNGTLSVKNADRPQGINGPLRSIQGIAVPTGEPGKLQVLFPGSSNPGNYWIVALGPVVDEQYQYSIVSDDRQVTLFVLAREPTNFKAIYEREALERVSQLGFNTLFNRPLAVQQEGCPATR